MKIASPRSDLVRVRVRVRGRGRVRDRVRNRVRVRARAPRSDHVIALSVAGLDTTCSGLGLG